MSGRGVFQQEAAGAGTKPVVDVFVEIERRDDLGLAIVIALFGTVLGLSVGLFFGWSMVHALADQGFKSFVVPTGSLLVVAAIAAIATQ